VFGSYVASDRGPSAGLPAFIARQAGNDKAYIYNDGSASFVGAVSSPNACTAWVNFSGSNATFRDQFNVGNITRVEAGRYSVPFTTPMNNANYCIQVSSNQLTTIIDSQDVNGFQMSVFDGGGSRVDTTIICAAVFGGK